MVDDVVVGIEDAVGQPVVAHELPDVLDRIELGRAWRQGENSDVGGLSLLLTPTGAETQVFWVSQPLVPPINSIRRRNSCILGAPATGFAGCTDEAR